MKFVIIIFLQFYFLPYLCFGLETDSIVELDINIKGKGLVISNIPPPYIKGQTISLSFYPSGGYEFVTKPNVLLASEKDSLFGWVFDHWSFSDSSLQEHSGLENPLTITLQSNRTLYVSFIQQGTAGHLTNKQYQQLMLIRTGNYKDWQPMSDDQREGLSKKSGYYLSNFKKDNQKWGQPATVWWKDFVRNNPLGYDYLGEGTTWAGLILQALALKYREMPTDTATIHDILNVLKALDRNTKIAGASGRVSRFSGPANDHAYQWYYKKVKVGAHSGTTPWQDMIWLGKPTRDTHTGLFVGLSSVGYFCRDNQIIFELAKDITEHVVDRLILDNWKIKGLDNDHGVINEKELKQLQIRTAYYFNSQKYSYFKNQIDNFRLSLNKGKDLYSDSYWVEWMTWGRAFGIILLETSYSKRTDQIGKINKLFEREKLHLNPYYVGITAYLNSLLKNKIISSELDKWLQAELEGLLLAYPDGIKWNREINLFEDPQFTSHNQKHAKEAALPNQVFNADFNGQRSATRAKGGSNHQAYQFTNFDMFLTYWLAKASGRLNAAIYIDPGK